MSCILAENRKNSYRPGNTITGRKHTRKTVTGQDKIGQALLLGRPGSQNLRRGPAQRCEHQVLQQMAGIDQDARAGRGHQGMIDTINLLGIDVGPGQGGIQDAHGKQNIGIIEPRKIVGHSLFPATFNPSLSETGLQKRNAEVINCKKYPPSATVQPNTGL
jgi:hypothetical protein